VDVVIGVGVIEKRRVAVERADEVGVLFLPVPEALALRVGEAMHLDPSEHAPQEVEAGVGERVNRALEAPEERGADTRNHC
jgi:hypothetical protein